MAVYNRSGYYESLVLVRLFCHFEVFEFYGETRFIPVYDSGDFIMITGVVPELYSCIDI